MRMLSGRFVGNRDADVGERLGGVPRTATGLGRGAQTVVRRRALARPARRSARRLREALDRDIAAIDAMLSASSSTPSCTTPPAQAGRHLARPRLAGRRRRARPTASRSGCCNVGWPEICRDLERAIEFDQSLLFRKVYEEEFGMPGGEPYGLLVVDHEVRHRAGRRGAAPTTSARWPRCPASPPRPSRRSCSARRPALLEVDGFADLAASTRPHRAAAQRRSRALAQPGRRAPTCASSASRCRACWPAALAGRRHARRRLPLQRVRPDRDDRVWMSAGYAFAAVRRPRLRASTPGRPTCAASRPIASAAGSSPICRWSRFAPIPTMSGCASPSRSC